MKICVIGNRARYEKFMPDGLIEKEVEIQYFPIDSQVEEILAVASDAEVIFADAIAKVPRELVEAMPKLKLVHSEGVAYNGIDIGCCRSLGIDVCNCKGINKVAVAEQTLLLMLGVLRTVIQGNQAVLNGKQIKRKEWLMVNGIEELSEQTIGLIGFGDIGKETAKRLKAFGATVYYTSKVRKDAVVETEYNVTYLPMEELISKCSMISLHVPVNEETKRMVDKDFFMSMREGAYLINTSRGELIDNAALIQALESGKLQGAGLDTIAPEPVLESHLLLHMSEEAMERLLVSPHSAGITTATFRRGHTLMWENAERVMNGQRPLHIVNE